VAGFLVGRGEIPDNAVEYVARQVGVAQTEIAFYEWSGRTNRFHRNQIRGSLGFRECSVADADTVTDRRSSGALVLTRFGHRRLA
jgi:Domain of unknown function (DUF4158)